MDVAVVLASWF